MMRVGLVFLLVLWIGGCRSTAMAPGSWPEDVKDRRIQVGVNTDSQFVELLGKPDVATVEEDGKKVWTFTNRLYEPETGIYARVLTIFPSDPDLNPDIDCGYDLILHFDLQNRISDYFLVPSQY